MALTNHFRVQLCSCGIIKMCFGIFFESKKSFGVQTCSQTKASHLPNWAFLNGAIFSGLTGPAIGFDKPCLGSVGHSYTQEDEAQPEGSRFGASGTSLKSANKGP